MSVHIEFFYDKIGFGDLAIIDSDTKQVIRTELARSGYRNKNGKLICAIPEKRWFILHPSVATTEKGMFVTIGMGWKIRLYTAEVLGYSHYLIHPDGNNPGSLGCIVLPENDGIEFRALVDAYQAEQGTINVYTKLIKGVAV